MENYRLLLQCSKLKRATAIKIEASPTYETTLVSRVFCRTKSAMHLKVKISAMNNEMFVLALTNIY